MAQIVSGITGCLLIVFQSACAVWQIVVSVGLFAHVVGCLWIMIGNVESLFGSMLENSWIKSLGSDNQAASTVYISTSMFLDASNTEITLALPTST